jgi:hypothetical protein
MSLFLSLINVYYEFFTTIHGCNISSAHLTGCHLAQLCIQVTWPPVTAGSPYPFQHIARLNLTELCMQWSRLYIVLAAYVPCFLHVETHYTRMLSQSYLHA